MSPPDLDSYEYLVMSPQFQTNAELKGSLDDKGKNGWILASLQYAPDADGGKWLAVLYRKVT